MSFVFNSFILSVCNCLKPVITMRPAAAVCHSVCEASVPAHPATIIGPLPTHCGSVGTASSTVLATWPGTAHHNRARNPGGGICELVMNFELTDTGLLGNTALRPGVEEELCVDDCGVHLTFAHSWE